METLREKLIAARILQDLTQEQLAQRMNVARATIANWETGRSQPDYQKIRRLSEVLHYDFLPHNEEKTSGEGAKARKFRLNMTAQPIIEVISGENTCKLTASTVDFRIIGSDQHGNPVEIHAYVDFCVNSSSE